jgi:hypothetical protein
VLSSDTFTSDLQIGESRVVVPQIQRLENSDKLFLFLITTNIRLGGIQELYNIEGN